MAYARYPLVTVVALLAAGCASAGSESNAPSTSAPAPTFSSDAGSLTGLVTDDQIAPLVGADVALSGASQSMAKTDASGRFTFNDLPPGEFTVIAQKLGYESAAKKAVVEIGKTVEVSLILEPLYVATEPRQVQFQDRGYSSLSVYTFAVGVYDTAGKQFTRPVEYGARDIVSSMVWSSATPVTARYAWLDVAHGDLKNRTAGRSPVTTFLTDLEVEGNKEKFTLTWRWDFACGINPTCLVANPDTIIPQVAYEQSTDIYSTVFYVDPAPHDYVAYPK